MRIAVFTLCLLLVVGSTHGWGRKFFRPVGQYSGHPFRHAAKKALGHAAKQAIKSGFGDEEKLLNFLKDMDEDQYAEFMDQLGKSLSEEFAEDEAFEMLRSLDDVIQRDDSMEDAYDEQGQ